MATPAAAGARATLDFFDAQANARRRTAVLVVAFALAFVAVVALVYAALAVAFAASTPSALAGAARTPAFQPALFLATAGVVGVVTGCGTAYHAARLSAGGGVAVAEMLGGSPVDRATTDL